MKSNKKLKNCFADKASLILRKMFSAPDIKWVVRDFIGKEGVSLGLSHEILESMTKQGYTERVKKGPKSYSLLTNKQKLLKDWLNVYRFDLNEVDTYYSPDKNILKKIKKSLKGDTYALTLHTGANLITSYVRTEDIYLYLKTQNRDEDVMRVRQQLELKELVKGGNVHIIRPYYKNSIFFNSKMIKGYRVVSSLQLYLDLYNFQPRGRDHAEYLKTVLEERDKSIA